MNTLKRPLNVAAADDDVSTFVAARPRMLAAALRTLGDVAEAEDVVQDAWLRWQRADRTAIRNPPAFLGTTSKRLALNRALGARTRYETLRDPWLAEPIDLEGEPSTCAERGEKLESAFLLLFAKLSALERAAYLLREAFGCSYRHISRVICSTEANSRQLVTRARKRLADRRPVLVTHIGLPRVATAFVHAVHEGDLTLLEKVLSAHIRGAAPSVEGSGRTSSSFAKRVAQGQMREHDQPRGAAGC